MAKNHATTIPFPPPPNQLDEVLREITWVLNHWPNGFNVKKEELLAIAADADTDDLDDLWSDHRHWFRAFLPSLNAWRDVSQSITEIETFKRYDSDTPSEIPDAIKVGADELNGLLAGVLEAYAPADRELVVLRDFEFTAATRELLKRYSRYTSAVCELAKKIWPTANLERLLQQV